MSDGPSLPASCGADERGPGSRRWILWVGAVVVVVLLVVGGFIAAQNLQKSTRKAWPVVYSLRAGGLGAQGSPAAQVDPKEAPGVYLWNDFYGWHLWIVTGEGVGRVTGTVTSDQSFDKAALATSNVGSIKADSKTIRFSLPADAKVVGIDFAPGFYATRLKVDVGNKMAIYEGNVKRRASSPLVIKKLDASDPAAAK
jgi:hypothetical protein